ncbi:MAG: hypothetical protein VW378_07550 [bacterium]
MNALFRYVYLTSFLILFSGIFIGLVEGVQLRDFSSSTSVFRLSQDGMALKYVDDLHHADFHPVIAASSSVLYITANVYVSSNIMSGQNIFLDDPSLVLSSGKDFTDILFQHRTDDGKTYDLKWYTPAIATNQQRSTYFVAPILQAGFSEGSQYQVLPLVVSSNPISDPAIKVADVFSVLDAQKVQLNFYSTTVPPGNEKFYFGGGGDLPNKSFLYVSHLVGKQNSGLGKQLYSVRRYTLDLSSSSLSLFQANESLPWTRSSLSNLTGHVYQLCTLDQQFLQSERVVLHVFGGLSGAYETVGPNSPESVFIEIGAFYEDGNGFVRSPQTKLPSTTLVVPRSGPFSLWYVGNPSVFNNNGLDASHQYGFYVRLRNNTTTGVIPTLPDKIPQISAVLYIYRGSKYE